MTGTTVTEQIIQVQARLKAIDGERRALEMANNAKRADLMDEEHELNARLAELTERAKLDDISLATDHASLATDLTRSPRLPGK